MASIHSNRGAKRAREARTELGLGLDGPLGDLLEAVEGPGGAHVVVLDLGDGVAGAYLARADRPLIFVNGRQGPVRQRFTLAHELGHHRLGHATVMDRPAALSDYGHDPWEVEANAFAAELLLPRAALKRWAAEKLEGQPSLEDVVRLAVEHGLSAQMVRYRLETCGVLAVARRCEKLDREIAEGLHHEVADHLGLEPFSDRLTVAAAHLPRIPPALRASPFGALLAGELDAEGLAIRTGQDLAAVRRMLANLGFDRLMAAV